MPDALATSVMHDEVAVCGPLGEGHGDGLGGGPGWDQQGRQDDGKDGQEGSSPWPGPEMVHHRLTKRPGVEALTRRGTGYIREV